MAKLKLSTILKRLDACDNAREWARGYGSLDDAWAVCPRSDWMIWLLARTTINQNVPEFRLMACDFAEAVLHLVPAGEDRPRRAIEVARAFASGTGTRYEMDAARDAALDAAWAAARASAGASAGDAAWAAARASAGDAAGDAAITAALDAAWAAARASAGASAGAAQANIIRKYFPTCPPIKVNRLRVVA